MEQNGAPLETSYRAELSYYVQVKLHDRTSVM